MLGDVIFCLNVHRYLLTPRRPKLLSIDGFDPVSVEKFRSNCSDGLGGFYWGSRTAIAPTAYAGFIGGLELLLACLSSKLDGCVCSCEDPGNTYVIMYRDLTGRA